jgi:hypothetical protein
MLAVLAVPVAVLALPLAMLRVEALLPEAARPADAEPELLLTT